MIQKSKADTPAAGTSAAAARVRKLSPYYQALLRRVRAAGNGLTSGQMVGVTSCGRRAGVTTVAINLAVSAAQAGIERVLLVDTNIGERSVQRAFRVRPALGLVDVLSGAADPLDCVETCRVDNLSILAAGGSKNRVAPIYDLASWTAGLDVLKRHFRFLVFDLPPATELTPCFALASELDGVVLVVEAERADHRAALRAKQQLDEVNARLLGVVFNKN